MTVLPPSMDAGPLEDAVRAELVAAGVERTSAGQAALALARQVDDGHQQPAGLVKQMHESMDRVLVRQAGRSRLEVLRERRGS